MSQTLPTLHSNRKFGIEIECFGMSIDRAVEVIRNAGIEIYSEGYNHQTRSHWKIVTDSSVANGFEVVSPILYGNEGLADVRKVAEALVGAGARVDRRCGFHVHVDARDLLGADILNIVRRYAKHEVQIDSFMPPSRRSGNDYCRTMENVIQAIRNVSESATTRQVCERVYERYYKLNIQAFVRHGTVEFRQHSGTVDWCKMVNWIIFCIHFVEDSRTIQVRTTATTVPGASVRRNAIELKFRKLAELLDRHSNRYNPIRGSDIAATLGVEEATVPSYISMFRSRYPAAQIGARRNMGYYRACPEPLLPMVENTNPELLSVRLETPQDQGVLASLAPEVANYFRERVADISLQ